MKTISRYSSGPGAPTGGSSAGGFASSYGGAATASATAAASESSQQQSGFKAFTPAAGLTTSAYVARSTYDEVASSSLFGGSGAAVSGGGDVAGNDQFSSGPRMGSMTPYQSSVGSRF